MLDLLIYGGTVVDGSGKPGFKANLGVKDGRIVKIGDFEEEAAETLDATGLVVSPGFIDIHTHYDAQVFWDPTLSPSSCHGVTTVLAGNCGFSIAPLSGRAEDSNYLAAMLSRVEGMPLESLKAGVPWDWTSFAEYLGKLDGKVMINMGFLVGHSALRRAIMGSRAVGEQASKDEIAQMQSLLRTSLAAGGLGFSSTQSTSHLDADGNPVPSRYATDEELMGLCAVVREFEGTYLEFLPGISGFFDEETLNRMTTMSVTANRVLNWNLLMPNSANPASYHSQLSAGDHARERGGRVLALAAPKPPVAVITLESGAGFEVYPGWGEVFAKPLAERKALLADPAVRRRLNDSIHAPDAGPFRAMGDWSRWLIVETFLPEHKALNGMTVGAYASQIHKAPLDALLDLGLAENLKTRFTPAVGGDDRESWRMRGEAWQDPRALIGGSDAGAHLDMLDTFAFSSQVLQLGVRERGLLDLETAVHLMTALPAQTFGLRDRGLLESGYCADIVVFDPKTIGCGPVYGRADLPAGAERLYADPIGVHNVIVNGKQVMRNAESTGQFPGTVFRSGRDTFTVLP